MLPATQYEPTGHSEGSAAPAIQNLPAAQTVQTELPSLLKVPAAHVVQSDNALAPATPLNVPDRHGV